MGHRRHPHHHRLRLRPHLHQSHRLSTRPELGQRVLDSAVLRHADGAGHHDRLHPGRHPVLQPAAERSGGPSQEQQGRDRHDGGGVDGPGLHQLGAQHRRLGRLRALHGAQAEGRGLPPAGLHCLSGSRGHVALGAFGLGAAPGRDPQALPREGDRDHPDHRDHLPPLQPPAGAVDRGRADHHRPDDAPQEGRHGRGGPGADRGGRLRGPAQAQARRR